MSGKGQVLSVLAAVLLGVFVVQAAVMASEEDLGRKVRAMRLEQQNKHEEALQILQDIIQKHEDADIADFARFQMAAIKHKVYRETSDQVRKRYNEIKEKDGVQAAEEDVLRTGMSAQVVALRSDAVQKYQEVVSATPESKYLPDAKQGKADLYLEGEQYEAALAAYDELIAQYPKMKYAAHAQHNKGVCYFSQKKYEEALAEFQKVLTDYADSPYARIAKRKIVEVNKAIADAAAQKTLP